MGPTITPPLLLCYGFKLIGRKPNDAWAQLGFSVQTWDNSVSIDDEFFCNTAIFVKLSFRPSRHGVCTGMVTRSVVWMVVAKQSPQRSCLRIQEPRFSRCIGGETFDATTYYLKQSNIVQTTELAADPRLFKVQGW